MFDFGQPVLNVMFEANPIKNMLEGEAVALVIGKLNAIVSQNHVNDIGMSMAETNCATWRGKSVPIWLREKGNAALGSDWFVGIV